MDPEHILQSTPGFLRWIIRQFFLDDVMNRYYDLRLVFVDILANLYKEQKAELIEKSLKIFNDNLPSEYSKISMKEIDSYYREDKLTWVLF